MRKSWIYEDTVGLREGEEKTAAKHARGTDIEMREVERSVRGTKRKMYIQLTPGEKAEKEKVAKQKLLAGVWLAAAAAVTTTGLVVATARKQKSKTVEKRPAPNRVKIAKKKPNPIWQKCGHHRCLVNWQVLKTTRTMSED